ncbi:tetratricopeptide repeat-containing sensor histidine kinase [Taibaiella chishuiensis]|uniref:Tetratricopeptide repeat protein n=1 Tax=Taibaiella chishuiensis TaxID=1434707 RepID=A0A2P8CZS5_9BACT|nr:ATP-binding protein [Taibaiella chishuiensis]PSK90464.1 tetratricopeptide repeat protein [Taibaiella chishuiensis]
MRCRPILLLLLLLLPWPAHAQSSFIESFIERQVQPPVSKAALDKMEAELRLIERLYTSNPDSALALCRIVYEDSKRMQFPDGMATALLWTGGVYMMARSEPKQALRYYRNAAPYCARAINVRSTLLLLLHTDMAAAFSVQGQYDSALVYYYKALTTVLQYNIKDARELAILNSNLAAIHYVLGQYEEAVPYIRTTIRISDSAGLPQPLFDALNSRASISITKGNLDSAARDIARMEAMPLTGARKERDIAYLKGMICLKQKDTRAAIPLFRHALEQSGANARDKSNNMSGLGLAYFLEGAYTTSARYITEAIQLSEEAGISGRALLDNYENLAEIYDSARDYKNAYRYRSMAAKLNDSMYKMENTKNLNVLQTRYLTAEKNKVLAEKQLQLAIAEAGLRKKNIWIMWITGGTLILLVLAAWLSQKQRLQLQKAKTARQQQQVQQLKAVIEGEEKERSRIGRQLHDDIMVQLSIVKMGMEALPMAHPSIRDAEGYRSIVDQLNHTSRQLRQTAHNLMPDTLLEEGLVSAVLYFCRNAEKLTGIRFRFQHYGDIPPLASDIEVSIYRVIQELVQNIIKHADAQNALVQLSYRKGILSITVEDDGTGMPAEAPGPDKMGLKSIRTRIKALEGNMDIHACTPHGTSVTIELNL